MLRYRTCSNQISLSFHTPLIYFYKYSNIYCMFLLSIQCMHTMLIFVLLFNFFKGWRGWWFFISLISKFCVYTQRGYKYITFLSLASHLKKYKLENSVKQFTLDQKWREWFVIPLVQFMAMQGEAVDCGQVNYSLASLHFLLYRRGCCSFGSMLRSGQEFAGTCSNFRR